MWTKGNRVLQTGRVPDNSGCLTGRNAMMAICFRRIHAANNENESSYSEVLIQGTPHACCQTNRRCRPPASQPATLLPTAAAAACSETADCFGVAPMRASPP